MNIEIFSFNEPQSIQEPVQKQLQQDVGNKKEVAMYDYELEHATHIDKKENLFKCSSSNNLRFWHFGEFLL